MSQVRLRLIHWLRSFLLAISPFSRASAIESTCFSIRISTRLDEDPTIFTSLETEKIVMQLEYVSLLQPLDKVEVDEQNNECKKHKNFPSK